MSYYRRCPKCGLKWNVSREAYLGPEYKCPACVGRAARPEWRRLSLDDLHAIRRGIEREMRELDAHSERHAGLFVAWQEINELIGIRGSADADMWGGRK